MERIVFRSTVVLVLAVIAFCKVQVAQASDYAGRTVRFIVATNPGGGLDMYARLIARNLSKHIEGKPSMIVANMPGGGGRAGLAHLYTRVKPDGFTMAHFIGTMILEQALGGEGIHFDARRFEMVGAPFQDRFVCALTRKSGIRTTKEWLALTKPLDIGVIAPGSSPDIAARVIGAALDAPMRIVSGYPGTAGIRAAAERGEVAGGCWGWDSIRVLWADALRSGEVRVVVQAVSKRLPDLPDVPTVLEIARTEEGKQLAKVLEDLGSMMRPFALPPGTPKSQVAVLRAAFMSTMADRDFLREAEKLGVDVDPLDGHELEEKVAELFERKTLLGTLKRVLGR